jgi:hypothetical protein
VLSVAGHAEQDGNVLIGNTAGATAALSVLAGGTYTLAGGYELAGVSTSDSLTNTGTMIRGGAAGLAEINLYTINNGLFESKGGTDLQFLQPVHGTGTIQIDSGALIDFDSSASAYVHVAFAAGAGGILRLGNGAPTFAATIQGFAGGDVIQLSEFDPTLATESFNAATNVLTVTDGSNTANLHFAAGLHASDFVLGYGQVGAAIFHA